MAAVVFVRCSKPTKSLRQRHVLASLRSILEPACQMKRLAMSLSIFVSGRPYRNRTRDRQLRTPCSNIIRGLPGGCAFRPTDRPGRTDRARPSIGVGQILGVAVRRHDNVAGSDLDGMNNALTRQEVHLSKPDPELFILVAERSKIPSGRTIVRGLATQMASSKCLTRDASSSSVKGFPINSAPLSTMPLCTTALRV